MILKSNGLMMMMMMMGFLPEMYHDGEQITKENAD